MRSSEAENPPAVIYLQWAPDAGHYVTWCIDQINDDDPKYALSSGSNQNQEGETTRILTEVQKCSGST